MDGGFMSTHAALEALLARVRDWWVARNELGNIDQSELGRIAGELGMTSEDLQDLVARGPDAADLLFDRMRALGIAKEDVERSAHGLMRDLEKTCACCNEKGLCEKDLTKDPADPGWRRYCPNAVTLDSLANLKGRSLA
jgi:hypothetical protein